MIVALFAMERPLRVLFVAAECTPFARAGALGDVIAAMPAALRRAGVDARVVIPRYGWISSVNTDGMSKHLAPLGVPLGDAEAWCAVFEATQPGADTPVYMLDHELLFDRNYLYDPPERSAPDNLTRFAFLARGAFQLTKHLGWIPDVMHAHDWPAALAATYGATLEAGGMLRRTATVLSIHDVGAQGRFSLDAASVTQLDAATLAAPALEDHGGINLLKGAIYHADAVTTLSEGYAKAIVAEGGGRGLEAALSSRVEGVRHLKADSDESWIDAASRCIDIYHDALTRRRRS
jgi:starch synthase